MVMIKTIDNNLLKLRSNSIDSIRNKTIRNNNQQILSGKKIKNTNQFLLLNFGITILILLFINNLFSILVYYNQ